MGSVDSSTLILCNSKMRPMLVHTSEAKDIAASNCNVKQGRQAVNTGSKPQLMSYNTVTSSTDDTVSLDADSVTGLSIVLQKQ